MQQTVNYSFASFGRSGGPVVGAARLCAEPVLIFVGGYSSVLLVRHADAHLVVPFAASLLAAANPGVAFLVAVGRLTVTTAGALLLVIASVWRATVRWEARLGCWKSHGLHFGVLCVWCYGSCSDQARRRGTWLDARQLRVGRALHLSRFRVQLVRLGIVSRDRPRRLTNSGGPSSASCVCGLLLLLFDPSS
jgi:hypothetical protein